ncbi:MAG: CocE/NonD family hydrolase [Gemmatimonadetes bacterium]|nr:CocE/NonD family hydrolase [Gemmatimonadota bacterium]
MMPLRPAVLALLAVIALPAGSRAQEGTAYEVVATRHVMVPSHDGVKLATDIYAPGRGGTVTGKYPAIVERTPYNKDSGADALVNYFVPRGYVVVRQDIRGRYRSEGQWRPLRDDGPDGAALLAWIAAQPWSNGKVGTVGTSYAGATQHAIALTGAPALTAMVPVDAMSNTGHYGVRHHGAFELRWLNWVFTLGNATGTRAGATGLASDPNAVPAAARAAASPEAAPALQDLGTRVREYARALPLRPGTTPLKHAPDYEGWLVEAMRHGDNDAWWREMGASVVDNLGKWQDVPAYHVTGWYDSWGTQVANMNYAQLAKSKRSLQRLIVGPWTHGGQGVRYSGIADFGPEAAIDMNALRLRWFDKWMRGVDNGVDREAPVRIFVMGAGDARKTPEGRVFVGGTWRDEREWPLARTQYTPYYLHADGRLSPQRPAPSAPTRYAFDPRNPVPTIGGNVSSEGILMPRGAQDQRCSPEHWLCTNDLPLSARSDVVVFQTAPLERDMEVTGPLVVKLWAGSDARDTDFTVKLVDVYPPSRDWPAGIDLIVADGIVRARYNTSASRATLLRDAGAREYTIETYPTSLVFRKGHRIRVDVSSSNFPRFDVNPNTGEPLNEQRRWAVANNTIWHDPQHPSHILLPVIPAGRPSPP